LSVLETLAQESSEPAADKTLATKQMGKHEENVAQIQANGAAAKIDPQDALQQLFGQ